MKFEDVKAYAGVVPPLILAALVGLFLWLRESPPNHDLNRDHHGCGSAIAAGLQLLSAKDDAQFNDALRRLSPGCGE